jgi:hypothetical protein
MIGLAAHRLFPGEAEPSQIFGERRFEFRATAGAVDILDPEQEAAAIGLGGAIAEERRMRVAEMQMACRTGRESRNYPGAGRKDHAGQK